MLKQRRGREDKDSNGHYKQDAVGIDERRAESLGELTSNGAARPSKKKKEEERDEIRRPVWLHVQPL